MFLDQNPQVRDVIFPDGWSSTDLDNIPKFQKAMPLFHVQIDFVLWGESEKDTTFGML